MAVDTPAPELVWIDVCCRPLPAALQFYSLRNLQGFHPFFRHLKISNNGPISKCLHTGEETLDCQVSDNRNQTAG